MSTAPVVDRSKSGIYPGLTYTEYAAIPAVRHSDLEGFKRTPAHAREAMLHGGKDTKALATGHAFHTFLLEPAKFWLAYAVPPKVDRRFKEDKAIWAEWERTHPNVLPVTQAEVDAYERMRDSILAHPTAAELLAGDGENELTVVWEETDEQTGEVQLCKARLDRLSGVGGYSFITDLKTALDAEEREFSKAAGRFGYFSQMAWYRRGLAAMAPAERRCAFIAIEKDPPFAVAVHEADERALAQGERMATRWLATFMECMRTGVWPAYPAGMSLIDYPSWLVDQLD